MNAGKSRNVNNYLNNYINKFSYVVENKKTARDNYQKENSQMRTFTANNKSNSMVAYNHNAHFSLNKNDSNKEILIQNYSEKSGITTHQGNNNNNNNEQLQLQLHSSQVLKSKKMITSRNPQQNEFLKAGSNTRHTMKIFENNNNINNNISRSISKTKAHANNANSHSRNKNIGSFLSDRTNSLQKAGGTTFTKKSRNSNRTTGQFLRPNQQTSVSGINNLSNLMGSLDSISSIKDSNTKQAKKTRNDKSEYFRKFTHNSQPKVRSNPALNTFKVMMAGINLSAVQNKKPSGRMEPKQHYDIGGIKVEKERNITVVIEKKDKTSLNLIRNTLDYINSKLNINKDKSSLKENSHSPSLSPVKAKAKKKERDECSSNALKEGERINRASLKENANVIGDNLSTVKLLAHIPNKLTLCRNKFLFPAKLPANPHASIGNSANPRNSKPVNVLGEASIKLSALQLKKNL